LGKVQGAAVFVMVAVAVIVEVDEGGTVVGVVEGGTGVLVGKLVAVADGNSVALGGIVGVRVAVGRSVDVRVG